MIVMIITAHNNLIDDLSPENQKQVQGYTLSMKELVKYISILSYNINIKKIK
jgi:hypothetical protein